MPIINFVNNVMFDWIVSDVGLNVLSEEVSKNAHVVFFVNGCLWEKNGVCLSATPTDDHSLIIKYWNIHCFYVEHHSNGWYYLSDNDGKKMYFFDTNDRIVPTGRTALNICTKRGDILTPVTPYNDSFPGKVLGPAFSSDVSSYDSGITVSPIRRVITRLSFDDNISE